MSARRGDKDMSGFYYIYEGAYLIVKNKKITTYSENVVCNKHPKLSFKEGELFCNKCGKRLTILSIPKEKFTDIYELLDETEFEDSFTIPDYLFGINDDHEMQILLSNNSECWVKGDWEYSSFVEITSDMPEKFIENFKTIHKKVLKFLEDKTESMKIEFGVVNHYS